MDPDLDLHCFQKRINPGSAGQGLKFYMCKKIVNFIKVNFIKSLGGITPEN